MSVEFGLWRIDGELHEVEFTQLPNEKVIEDAVENDPGIIGLNVLIIGRQVTTDSGSRLDLLGIDSTGDLVAIELKRDRTPRDVVAQVLDYGSWVANLGYEEIAATSNEVWADPFEEVFAWQFGEAPPEALNENHQLVVVASSLDSATERIINYLSTYQGVAINAVFFRYFKDGDAEYLARSWLVDPADTEQKEPPRKAEPWNGHDYYVSIGESDERTWNDCRRYGFVSGGQGIWYSNTLKLLSPGDRVFAHIPKVGYVGVGEVTGVRTRIAEATVEWEGEENLLLDLPWQAPDPGRNSDDEKLSEYVVNIEWSETRDRENPIWDAGMFANQNTVCRLRNRFTLDKLCEAFGVEPV
mgnify:CR=1 FL=1|jgi:hypothetical protein